MEQKTIWIIFRFIEDRRHREKVIRSQKDEFRI